MGKASSSKKVARAAKAAGRPGAKKSYAWPAAIGAVVILGVLLVVLSFGGGTSNAVAPRVGDHWHAAYGVYKCDAFQTSFSDAAGDKYGIHTHGEGLMHIHPFTSRVTGTRANLSAFFSDVGAKVTDTSIKSDALALDVKNGDKCGGKVGHVELWKWSDPTDTKPTVVTKDITKFHPQNNNIWVLAFVAPGTKPTLPQSAINLQDPLAAEQGRTPSVGGSTTSVPGTSDSSTTIPAGGSTTIPPSDSSTTQPAPTTTAAP